MSASSDRPVVIVGSGVAGYAVAQALRRQDPDVPLVMITADGGEHYPKPTLSNALARGRAPEALIRESVTDAAARLDMTVQVRRRVVRIERGPRRLFLDDGDEQPYRALVLAMGADPICLPLGGDAAGEVFSVNDLDDYRRFREALAGSRRVALLGSGLIGCEFANDLAASGVEVTVMGLMEWPLDRLLPRDCGDYLAASLARAGVAFRLGVAARRVDRIASGLRVGLDGGDPVEADLVLSAVGLQPRVSLAGEADLATGSGIVVDPRFATSDDAIYAIGDCAELGGEVRPYIAPINHGAPVLVENLLGGRREVAYPPMPVAVKTPACPVLVQPPDTSAVRWQSREADGGMRALARDDDSRLRGFALLGACTRERAEWLGRLGTAE